MTYDPHIAASIDADYWLPEFGSGNYATADGLGDMLKAAGSKIASGWKQLLAWIKAGLKALWAKFRAFQGAVMEMAHKLLGHAYAASKLDLGKYSGIHAEWKKLPIEVSRTYSGAYRKIRYQQANEGYDLPSNAAAIFPCPGVRLLVKHWIVSAVRAVVSTAMVSDGDIAKCVTAFQQLYQSGGTVGGPSYYMVSGDNSGNLGPSTLNRLTNAMSKMMPVLAPGEITGPVSLLTAMAMSGQPDSAMATLLDQITRMFAATITPTTPADTLVLFPLARLGEYPPLPQVAAEFRGLDTKYAKQLAEDISRFQAQVSSADWTKQMNKLGQDLDSAISGLEKELDTLAGIVITVQGPSSGISAFPSVTQVHNTGVAMTSLISDSMGIPLRTINTVMQQLGSLANNLSTLTGEVQASLENSTIRIDAAAAVGDIINNVIPALGKFFTQFSKTVSAVAACQAAGLRALARQEQGWRLECQYAMAVMTDQIKNPQPSV